MPASARRLPAPFLVVVVATALPVAAAGGSLPFGFNTVWEMWVVAAILLAAALGCFRWLPRPYQGILGLPRWALLAAVVVLVSIALYHADPVFPRRDREHRILHVKRVVGGWSVWTDTAHMAGDKWVLLSFLGRDSGSLFALETHLDKVREHPRSFLCFNLYDSPEPQRYSDTAKQAVALEIHRFNALSRQGLPKGDIHYDFTVKRSGRTFTLQGRLDGIDIGGAYAANIQETMPILPPADWQIPEDYRRTTSTGVRAW